MVKALTTINHETEIEPYFLSQYSESQIFKNFVKSFVGELDSLETEFTAFKNTLSLFTATSGNLDKWGSILQADQRPYSDDLYRVLLFALVAAYNSQGHSYDIKQLILAVLKADGIHIDDNNDGSFSFTVLHPRFTFGVALVSDIVTLAKPAGVEFIGFTIADLYSEPTFSFNLDTRENASTYAVAVPEYTVASNWTNYVYAGSGAISLSDRIKYVSSGDKNSINFITALSDTQWRTDIDTAFTGAVGSIIAWQGKDGSLFHILSLSTSGTVSHTTSGTSVTTEIILTDSDDNSKCLISRNRRLLVPDALSFWSAQIDYTDADGPITLGQSLIESDMYASAYYSSYVFPASGAIAGTTRIRVHGSVASDLKLEFSMDLTNGALFDTELNNTIETVAGSEIGLVDKSGSQWVIKSGGSMTTTATTIAGTWMTIDVFIVQSGTLKAAEIRKDGSLTTASLLLSQFSSYDQSEEATFNTKNSSGIGKTFSYNSSSNRYGVTGGGRYSIFIA